MSDVPDVSPLNTVVSEPHHLRLDSGASTASSDYDDGTCLCCSIYISVLILVTHIVAPAYPPFSFYPNPFFSSDGSVDTDSHNFSRYSTSPPPRKPVGLLEPKNSFLHRGLVP